MFATTVDYRDDARYAAQAHLILESPAHFPTMADELNMLWRILQIARQEQLLLLRSSWGRLNPDVIAAALLGLLPAHSRPILVLKGCMWEPDKGVKGVLVRRLVQLADRAIRLYAVQSSEELTLFPQTWGLSAGKTRLCPYFYTLTEQDLTLPPPPVEEYVFAGGNSHRRYEPLIEAAKQFSNRHFIFATDRLAGQELPPNVTAKPVPHRQFVALMQGAAVVVVPLQAGLHRASGQQTYLNAMWLGKPTIVAETLAVRDHITHGETALITDGTAASYVQALQYVFAPGNQEKVRKMAVRAKEVVESQFSFANHVTHLLQVVAEAAGDKDVG